MQADDLSAMEIELDELRDVVEIIVDEHGVPHLYARSADDAFFAQGFNAARDRLWQIDFWRRRGLGRLAEVWGEDFVDADAAARHFLYRGDLHPEWLAYGSDTQRICTRFAAGVNAFIGLTEDDPTLLPPEFAALDYRPARWDPSDIVRIRFHGPYLSLADEVARTVTTRSYGEEVEDLRQRREPYLRAVVPDGLDLSRIEASHLRIYERATGPLGRSAPGRGHEGSNNWVLSGDRTATGRPILANDPHRDTTSLPGMRYLVHLVCPEFDVIGAGEPQLPGISIGHNGTIAFGFTVMMADQEDLYVYDLDPDDPSAYRYRDRYVPFEIVDDHIDTAGGERRAVRRMFTRHGPVIHHDPEQGFALAARMVGLCPGAAPYLTGLEVMRATTWDQFLASMSRWGTPGENMVYADVAGNIGWKPAGLVPVRVGWDGLFPVPGDGRYEWHGFHDMDALPVELNPDRGWIATANEYRLHDSEVADSVGFVSAPDERRRRLDEVLGATTAATVADMAALQLDDVSVPARDVLGAVALLSPDNGDLSAEVRALLAWDHRMSVDSREALVFETWFWHHLRPTLLRRFLSHAAIDGLDVAAATDFLVERPLETGDTRHEIAMLRDPDLLLGMDPEEAMTMVSQTLDAAIADLVATLGTEEEGAWTWGRVHHVAAAHPLADLLVGAIDPGSLEIGPAPRAGSFHTVGLGAYDADRRQAVGSTVRFVFDVGAWDESVAMNAPGQSGDSRSRFHTDLFDDWVQGRTFPLLYARERVERAAVSRLHLRPRASREPSSPPS